MRCVMRFVMREAPMAPLPAFREEHRIATWPEHLLGHQAALTEEWTCAKR